MYMQLTQYEVYPSSMFGVTNLFLFFRRLISMHWVYRGEQLRGSLVSKI